MSSRTTLTKILMAIAALMTTDGPLASNVDYQFAGIQFVDQNLDDYDCSQDGLEVYGSYEVSNRWFALGSLADVSGNRGCGSETVTVGAGARNKFNDIFDLYGTLSLESTSPDSGSSDAGLVLRTGFRGVIGDSLEGSLGLAHHTTFAGTTSLDAGLVYWLTGQVSATAAVNWGTDVSSFSVGARLRF